MTCKVSWIDRSLKRSFYHLGILISKHPGYFIIIPILLSLLCFSGYQQLHYQLDPEYLFSPINGEGKTERAIVEQYFKVNYTHRFNVGRITRPGRFGRVIVITKDGNSNMIRQDVFQELRLLDNLIQNATVSYEGESFTYRDACARWENECFENDILNLDYILDDVESGELNLTFPLMFNPVTWDAHAFPVYFGGTELTEDNVIISVPAIQLVYFVTSDNKRQDDRGAEWEEVFLSTMAAAEKSNFFKHISVAYFASRTLDHELEKNTKTVIPYFTSTFILMAFFSVITCMMGDAVKSKPWLGLMGNVSAVMATCAAFGLAMYLGIEFIGINLAAPFLMIGIGIDDTFVMLAAWRRTSPKMSVEQRMGHTMSEAAVSITITSLTDILSFWIGIISPFRSVKIFCKYSVLAVCFTFLWHITFFAACMAISGFREHRNRHALLGCQVQPLSVAIKEDRGLFYRAFMAGGINYDDPDNLIDNKDHVLMEFFKNKMANVINNKWCKILILMVFAGYLAGACYGLTQIKEGLERRKLSRSDSYSVEFFDREDDYYREFPYRMQVVITGDLNYSDPIVQNEIEQLTRSLENTSYVTSALYTESWIRSFLSFVERNNDDLNISLSTEQEFIDSVRTQWLFPGNPFSLDVKFNENNTRIIASRFLIQAANITDTNHEKVMVRDLREICRNSALNATIFHPYFVFFDQFELIRPTSLQAMIIGAAIMMVTSFIFIPNILCSLWVAFSVISIELGVTGYMAIWSVNLDSLSMINLIMCIGFSVDFTAHICYTYMSSKESCPKARVREALHSLGLPIIQGSSSTILGIIALLLAQSYIFLVFFKMVFLVIFFGAMHGLFLLPVLLSLFGPGSWAKCINSDSNADNNNFKSIDKNKKSELFHITRSYYLQPTPTNNTKNNFGAQSLQQKDTFKIYGEEKDLGIGTSGEDSSESSSSRSQYLQVFASSSTSNDENIQQRYESRWAKPLSINHQNQCNCNDYIINDCKDNMSAKMHSNLNEAVPRSLQRAATTIQTHQRPHYVTEHSFYDNYGYGDNYGTEKNITKDILSHELPDRIYSIHNSSNSLINGHIPKEQNCSFSLSTSGDAGSNSDYSCNQKAKVDKEFPRVVPVNSRFLSRRFLSEDRTGCWRSSAAYDFERHSPPRPCMPKLSVMTSPCLRAKYHPHFYRNLGLHDQKIYSRRATSHQNMYYPSTAQRLLQTVYPIVQPVPLGLIN